MQLPPRNITIALRRGNYLGTAKVTVFAGFSQTIIAQTTCPLGQIISTANWNVPTAGTFTFRVEIIGDYNTTSVTIN